MHKISEQISTNKYRIISFLLGSLCMYILMFLVGFTLTGNKCIINGDMRDNYIPAIRNICRDIINGESIFYSWNYGMGMNTSLYNAYYSFSPLNILYLIFYNCRVEMVTVFCIIIKTGLAAMGFQIFVSRVNKVDGPVSVIFSVFYSMCSFQIAYNISNIIWLDALYMLPLVCMCIYSLVRDKKWIGLSVCYAYIFISNFYMGYMIAIAGTMFLFLFMIAYEKKSIKEAMVYLGRYAASVMAAIAVSAWVWIPTVLFMFGGNNVKAGMTLMNDLNKNGIDIVNQMFWGESAGYDALFPYIYCGIPSMILTPIFFWGKNVERRIKIGYGIILAVLFFSCVFSPIYIVWHGFDNPDSYPFRFSFIISFVLCTIASWTFAKMEKCNQWKLFIVFAAYSVVYIVAMLWQNARFDASLLSNTSQNLVVNVVLMLIWIGGIIYYMRLGNSGNGSILALLVLVTVIESISNGYVALTKEPLDISLRIYSDTWKLWNELEEKRTEKLSDDSDLYRVNANQGFGVSTGTTYGYNSISYFSSAENVTLRNTISKLGLLSSERLCLNYGLTEPTKMIFDVKYDTYISKKKEGENAETQYEEAAVDRNDYVLGMGFMVSGDSENYKLEGNNAFENINKLMSAMCGENIHIFDPIEPTRMYITGKGIDLYNDGAQYGLHYDEVTPEEEAKLVFNYDSESDDPGYAYIQNRVPSYYETFYLDGGYESGSQKWGAVTTSYIKDMEKSEKGYSVTIKKAGETNNVAFDNILFYSYDADALKEAYNLLKGEQLNTAEWKDGYYKGTIEVKDDKKLLFTSIPYEAGWTAYVNEKEVEIVPVLNEAFVGLELPGKGNYNIEFVFEAPGRKIGIIVSLIGVLAIVFAVMTEGKRKRVTDAEKENE